MNAHLNAGFDLSPGSVAKDDDLFNRNSDSAFRFHAESNLFDRARTIADQIESELAAVLDLHPDTPNPGLASYLFSLQFHLAMEEIPFLDELSQRAPGYSSIDLWDTLAPPSWIAGLFSGTQPTLKFSSVGMPDRTTIPAAGGTEPPKKHIPLLIVGSPIDLTLGRQYLEHTAISGRVNVILKKRSSALLNLVETALSEYELMSINYLYDLPTVESQISKNTPVVFSRLNATSDIQKRRWLCTLLTADRLAGAIERFVAAYQPSKIFGTFEKSPIGVVLSKLRRRYQFDLISYQHGIMGATRTMDRLHFDQFFVWSDSYLRLARSDGYPVNAAISVPNVREVTDLDDKTEKQPIRKIVFFEQPLSKGPYSVDDYRNLLLSIADIAADRELVLSVKPHPRTYDDRTLVQLTQSIPGVRRLGPDENMASVTKNHDLALSISSTALLDFHLHGKPSIAIDPKNWADIVGLPPDAFPRRSGTNAELQFFLDELGTKPVKRKNPLGWLYRKISRTRVES